jgi:hypothetical protein
VQPPRILELQIEDLVVAQQVETVQLVTREQQQLTAS